MTTHFCWCLGREHITTMIRTIAFFLVSLTSTWECSNKTLPQKRFIWDRMAELWSTASAPPGALSSGFTSSLTSSLLDLPFKGCSPWAACWASSCSHIWMHHGQNDYQLDVPMDTQQHIKNWIFRNSIQISLLEVTSLTGVAIIPTTRIQAVAISHAI